MSEPVRDRKTQPTDADVEAYLAAIPDEARRADAREAVALFREVTGMPPRMWGTSMVGFGTQRYAAADGKIREALAVGLAARSSALTLYGLTFYGSNDDLLERLGKHTTGKGCLYVKRLADLDRATLREIIARGWATNHHTD
ncbi:MAG: DUF1801 domain-containing protein [Actinomycetales bacterium]|jgi:hypothetical protein|nr:DUF1801 domain-containing protein [Candidatus Phosphoribacter baldrii]HRC13634.1 DUF1801 domain-containing protein [Dermatophilaceae bacterium]